MQPRRIEILPSFQRSYEALPQKAQKRVEDVLALFSERTADNALRPELKNGFDNVWSIRVTQGYRAFYKKLRDTDGAIYCMFHVGHHDDYRLLNKLASRVSISINTRGGEVNMTVQTSPAGHPPQTKKEKRHSRR